MNEQELLKKYECEFETHDYEHYANSGITIDGYAVICAMKDRTNARLNKQVQAAKDVINMIAEYVGINPKNTGYYLYAPDYDDSSPLLEKIDEYFSRSGDKVKMKKRIEELENENSVLRSLIHK